MSNIIRYISEISRCGAQFRSDSLSEMGLKACHSSYLTQICENPGISQDKLSRLICINKSNVARQVAALASIYGGYRLFGLPGMLLAPLVTVAAVQMVRLRPEKGK